jgi:hypothetical protein
MKATTAVMKSRETTRNADFREHGRVLLFNPKSAFCIPKSVSGTDLAAFSAL